MIESRFSCPCGYCAHVYSSHLPTVRMGPRFVWFIGPQESHILSRSRVNQKKKRCSRHKIGLPRPPPVFYRPVGAGTTMCTPSPFAHAQSRRVTPLFWGHFGDHSFCDPERKSTPSRGYCVGSGCLMMFRVVCGGSSLLPESYRVFFIVCSGLRNID